MCGYLFTLPVGFCLFVVFVIDSVCALVVIWLCLLVNSVVVGQSFVLKPDGLIVVFTCGVYLQRLDWFSFVDWLLAELVWLFRFGASRFCVVVLIS